MLKQQPKRYQQERVKYDFFKNETYKKNYTIIIYQRLNLQINFLSRLSLTQSMILLVKER